jgi:hypothetical protein
MQIGWREGSSRMTRVVYRVAPGIIFRRCDIAIMQASCCMPTAGGHT